MVGFGPSLEFASYSGLAERNQNYACKFSFGSKQAEFSNLLLQWQRLRWVNRPLVPNWTSTSTVPRRVAVMPYYSFKLIPTVCMK